MINYKIASRALPLPTKKIRMELVLYLILTLGIILIYGQTVNFDLIHFDDQKYITTNPHVTTGISYENIRWAFTNFLAGMWMPLTWLSFMLDTHIFGSNPGGYHFTNFLLHLINAALTFILLQKMTRNQWMSAGVALLFAFHPLHVESVAWVTERKDVLSCFFWITTLIAYLHYRQNKSRRAYFAIIFLYLLGLFSKPMVVTLPLILLMLDVWPLHRFNVNAPPQPRTFTSCFYQAIIEKVPLFALMLLFAGFTLYFNQDKSGALASFTVFPLLVRIQNAVVSYGAYLIDFLWPFNLAVFYPHEGANLANWKIALSFFSLCLITFAVIKYRKERPALLFGWLWYLLILFPVIGITQSGMQARADRFVYIPSIGIYLITISLFHDIVQKYHLTRRSVGLLSALFFSMLLVNAHQQTRYWQNSLSLFGHNLTLTGNQFMINSALGRAYLDKERFDEAIRQFQISLTDYAYHAETLHYLGNAFAKQQNHQKAIVCYQKSAKIDPSVPTLHNDIGNSYLALQNKQEAFRAYKRAIDRNPNFYQAYFNLGNLFFTENKFQQAIQFYKKAIIINPAYKLAHGNMGSAYFKLGQYRQAEIHYRRALQIDPNFKQVLKNLQLLKSKPQTLHRKTDSK